MGPRLITRSSDPGDPPVLSWDSEPERERFVLDLSAELPCFEGHFPSNPILPGVVQLHWAIILARRAFGIEDIPVEILRLKFHAVAVPPLHVELQLEHVAPHRVNFSFLSHASVHSRGTLLFNQGS